jgi:hypothetical protein
VPSFALVACDHGFGHIRRLLLIAAELSRRGASVTIFAPSMAVDRFATQAQLDAAGIRTLDVRTRTTIPSLRRGDVGPWVGELPALDEFDVVVSDNLPEILQVRSDAVLSGSFLWHLVIDGIDPVLHEATELLLARHRPRMIASSVFAMPDLAPRTNLTTVGLFASAPRPNVSGEDLLIACGGTPTMQAQFQALIDSIVAGPAPPFATVWVEPRLMPAGAPRWMRAATFDDAMYRRALAVVCRPGVGTLTDCAWSGARAFMAWEPGNAELAFNARRFVELEIGEETATPADAYMAACAFWDQADQRLRHAEAVAVLDFDGARETAELLMGLTAH